ncbi:hypothetical protein Tco_1524170 [Tanacetum coccineum]
MVGDLVDKGVASIVTSSPSSGIISKHCLSSSVSLSSSNLCFLELSYSSSSPTLFKLLLCVISAFVSLPSALTSLPSTNYLKENVHAIQVGCQICEGPHLDKECPLNEEVKPMEEVKYGEFGRPTPFNGSNRANFYVGPPGYYTRTDNQTPSGEKRPNLVETGAAKRQAE